MLSRSRLQDALSPRQLHAARQVVAMVRARVAAELLHVCLFGSRARGDARRDSDVDLLLVFRHLPPDREPFASQAERIAEGVARRQRVPVSVWSVALIDLAHGHRTPMLVDALEDAIPLWSRDAPLGALEFTRRDALACTGALLERAREGSGRVKALLAQNRTQAAARRMRDDLVRLCTATTLLEGITRPRRGAAVRRFIERELPPPEVRAVLEWAERSFGTDGKDERATVPAPPMGFAAAARVIEALRRGVARRRDRLRLGGWEHDGHQDDANPVQGMDFALPRGDSLPHLRSRSRTRP